MEYDYIIIGSGFGGAVSALRLSDKGYKVLVIEKGKWYKAKDFPKSNWNIKKWMWIPFFRCFGILKMTFLKHITAGSGVGVGGGSLGFANTLIIPKSKFFSSGTWSKLNNWEEELKENYFSTDYQYINYLLLHSYDFKKSYYQEYLNSYLRSKVKELHKLDLKQFTHTTHCKIIYKRY